MNKSTLYTILFLLFPVILFGQMTIEKKADYILYISQKITWANQDKIKTFTIGIYNDSEIETTLRLQAKNKQFHNHPIQIISLTSSSPLTNINMLYINKLKAKIDITDLVTKIKGKNILLCVLSVSAVESSFHTTPLFIT